MKLTRLARFTGCFVNLGFYLGILICAAVPLIIWKAGDWFPIFRDYYWPMVIIFLLSGILGVLIFYELKKIFGTLAARDPFVEANVLSLRRMGAYSFSICVVTAARLFFNITVTMLILILVFFIAGLFSLVLSQVFTQAVLYKQENDLTV
ncbi:MAG: DUF2975 domain-containing protein [Lachnospiraceae bacterium]|nr:DUF2975 domain-containing protein [Lachnospiraceae bacterium]